MAKPIITCRARSKQTGARCQRAPVPFTAEAGRALCFLHGGWSPAMLDRAEAAFRHYVLWGAEQWEPEWLRNQKIRAKLRSDDRRAARWAKKQLAKLSADTRPREPIPYEEAEEWDWSDVW